MLTNTIPLATGIITLPKNKYAQNIGKNIYNLVDKGAIFANILTKKDAIIGIYIAFSVSYQVFQKLSHLK